MNPVSFVVEDGIAVLSIDHPPVNALALPVREGLSAGLSRAAANPAVQAVVITGTPATFSAGADVNEIGSGAALTAPTLRDVQAQIESSAKPVVAAIAGNALGGGFELALACHWRAAEPAARLGLPEVKLGLIPGAGGTQRFTRLAGPQAALEVIPSGASLSAARAHELGLIDAVEENARSAGIALARKVLAEGRALRIASELTERLGHVDLQIFAAARQRLAGRARGQLAPQRIVDAIEAACTRSAAEGLALERTYFNECRDSPQRKALVHVFFAERAARRIPDLPAQVEPLTVRRAAVIGAGTMGGGIAMCLANAGIPVQIMDQSAEALERGLAVVRRNYAASVARGSLAQEAMDRALSLIEGVTDYGAIGAADLVIEAVFEDLEVKKAVFRELDRHAAPHAILATNTSTLDIDAIARATARPGQVVGTHFFSPANVMRLLENVRGTASSPATLATAMSLGRLLGKVVVLAGNCDGFIGNRMLQFYTGEAEFLLEEGATPEQVDRVMEEFGFAMGPLAVRDLAGNDVGYRIRKARRLPADERTSPILGRLVELGRLGQKSGKGFYRYEGRTRLPDPEVLGLIESVSRELGVRRREIPDEEIRDRLLHPLVNEGARILEEGIARRPGDIDVVYVHGYGFPAWRGGPMYWAEQAGLARVVATMQHLAPSHGSRWRPAALLERCAASGGGWEPHGA